ncbi:hypothetical protein C2G38_2041203 [Gigaspora rosea]|uniref:Ubiquitin-like domain-containing protein n=1 Tax=Gigaspora rosea TaxID=44941 RepID=A0A397USJ9_9GLOM|nr:hypothetical protein C2G38_2041203 [Gigaspora rosea]
MLLTSLLDPIPIFPIRLQYTTGSIYVANVTIHTTGEVLLKNFQNCVGPYGPSCKLSYHGKDMQLTDTIERLGIKEGDLVEAVDSKCKNSIKLSRLEVSSTPTEARSSMLIYLETSTGKTELKICRDLYNNNRNWSYWSHWSQQDICGETTIVILLKSGFKPGHHYDFLITDDCGKFLRNMTADLKAMFAGDGTTPFKAKLDDINLNCDNNGVLKCLHSQAC